MNWTFRPILYWETFKIVGSIRSPFVFIGIFNVIKV